MRISLIDFIDTYEPIQNPFKESGMVVIFSNENEMINFISKFEDNQIWEMDSEENIFPLKENPNIGKKFIFTKYPWEKTGIKVVFEL